MDLEMGSDSELALLLREAHVRGDRFERMTIAPHDYTAMIELRELLVTRIDGRRGRGTLSACLTFPWRAS